MASDFAKYVLYSFFVEKVTVEELYLLGFLSYS